MPHNVLYWTGGDWWGLGPGAHSHVGGTRWWNVRHPAAYAQRITAGAAPARRGRSSPQTNGAMERVMLATRLAEGCPVELGPAGRAAAVAAVADGLADPVAYEAGRLALTTRAGCWPTR